MASFGILAHATFFGEELQIRVENTEQGVPMFCLTISQHLMFPKSTVLLLVICYLVSVTAKRPFQVEMKYMELGFKGCWNSWERTHIGLESDKLFQEQ